MATLNKAAAKSKPAAAPSSLAAGGPVADDAAADSPSAIETDIETTVDKLALYTTVCHAVSSRCELLLQFQPVPCVDALHAPSPARAHPQLARGDSLESVTGMSEAQKKAHDTVLAWQLTRQRGTSIATAAGELRHDLVWARVSALLTDKQCSPSAVLQGFTHRRRTAVLRVAGFVGLHAVLACANVNSALREVVADIPASLSACDEDAMRGVAPDVDALLSIGGVTFQAALK